jgi:glutaredoxin
MKKTNVQVYFLEGCDKCKKLKATLDTLKIEYEAITCEDYPNMCDNIEDITGTDSYPMVKMEGHILYIATNYKDVGKIKVISDKVSTLGMYSIDNIIDTIKNY